MDGENPMDWSKAKNVLIIAFIITNLFLLYNLSKDVFIKEDLQLITGEYIEHVKEYLENNGITMGIDIPKEIVPLPILVVKYKTFEPKETASKFLGPKYDVINENTFQTEEKTVQIISNKELIYKYHGNNSNNYTISDKDAVRLGSEFLKKYELMSDDIQLQQIYIGRNEEFGGGRLYKLVYRQTYKDRFLGESYVHVYVNHKGVVGLEARLLEYVRTYPHKRKTIPATEALLKAMGEIVEENNGTAIITNIELGYYFNPTDTQVTDWQTVESGTAFPTWKITLENGKNYYIEALKN